MSCQVIIKIFVLDIPLVVASIGPYGAHLHDGSEYTGSYADYETADTIKKWHRARLDAVLEAGVDALAIETIPCLVRLENFVIILMTFNNKIYFF